MALPAIVVLENEEAFHGFGVGPEAKVCGVMGVSSLTAGFPDLLTDPFYSGKIMTFTCPHAGASGVVPGDLQSDAVAARAVVAKEIGNFAANRLGVEAMDAYLARNGIPGVVGVDTRAIAEIVARRGLMRAVVGVGKFADAELLKKEFAAGSKGWDAKPAGVGSPCDWAEEAVANPRFSVIVYDFGVKRGFLRRLAGMGCAVRLVPANYPAEKALTERPDGIVFSAGNGTPESRGDAVAAAKDLLGKAPLWGVGVGAGVLAAACGARVAVDGRGHMGAHPVGRNGEPSGEITAQCHEFWLERESFAGAGLEETHFNLNDGTVEGFASAVRNLMGVLFHPEAEPGQRDSLYLFDRFNTMMMKK